MGWNVTLTGDPGVGGSELGPYNGPVDLCRLQFGGEALRTDGLFGVILPSFILLTDKLANVLFGVFGDTRKGRTLRIGGVGGRRSVIAVQEIKKLKIKIEQKYGNRR